MSAGSKIEWCDSTWNPVRGCTRVSPGCGGPGHAGGCYAETVAARFSDPGQPYHGFAERGRSGSKWTGNVALIESQLDLPLRWKKPRRIFVNSMSDLFHEDLPDEAIDKVFAIMALAPQHTFQVLTKRAERMREYVTSMNRELSPAQRLVDALCIPRERMVAIDWPLFNVWLGVSVEDQARANERIPHLLATPAAVRFISAEPLLGPVDLTWIAEPDEERDGVIDSLLGCNWIDGLGRGIAYEPRRPGHIGRRMTREVVSANDAKIDWIIVGGESGPGARPHELAWHRSLRDQCKAADVAFFEKQLGAAPLVDGAPLHLKDRKGGDWSEWPADLRVREFPQ